jgi:acyl dehydratase
VPLNQALVGKAYPAVRYEVGREKLREFAIAVGETDPIYHDEAAARAAGHPDLPAVPTFAVVLSLRAGQVVYGDPELGLDYSRVVHGEQEFVHHRPIRAGDRLVATTTIDAVRNVAGNDLLTTRVDLATEDGEAVCTATSMLVGRGA